MKNLVLAAALWALAPVASPALAQTLNNNPPGTVDPGPPNAANPAPLKPGGIRITTAAPEPDKWDGQKSANGMQRLFQCKRMACSDSETVAIGFSKSPTRHPDPQALDKLAKVDLPRSIQATHAANAAHHA